MQMGTLLTRSTQLLYDVQLLALSEHLPYVSKLFHNVYHAASPTYRARYIFFRLFDVEEESEVYTRALRYPLCNIQVFDCLRTLVHRHHPPSGEAESLATSEKTSKKRKRARQCDLPRRLFKNLERRGSDPWTDEDNPLPFLRHIFDAFKDASFQVNPNAFEGYALTKAVHVQSMPLIRFLLTHGASPESKDCLAIMVAIRQKNLALVKLLIEREDIESPSANTSKKRRKIEDRVKPDAKMLKVAVQCKARAITEYFSHEKGVVPDLQTLMMM